MVAYVVQGFPFDTLVQETLGSRYLVSGIVIQESGATYALSAGTGSVVLTGLPLYMPDVLQAGTGAVVVTGKPVNLIEPTTNTHGAWDKTKALVWAVIPTNGDRTLTSGTIGGNYYSTDGHQLNAGLFYAEIKVDTRVGTETFARIGVVNDDASKWIGVLFDGLVSTDIGPYSTYPSLAWTTGSIIRIAYNTNTNQIWFAVNAGIWNGSGTANPATGVGGFGSFIGAGVDIFLSLVCAKPGNVVTITTGGRPFAYTPPSGYVAWYDPGPTHGAWDTTTSNANIYNPTFSNNDRTFAAISGTGATITSTDKQTSGVGSPCYVEIKCDVFTAGDTQYIAIQDTAGHYVQVQSNGTLTSSAAGTIGTFPTLAFGAGNVIQFAYNPITNLVWIRRGGGAWAPSGDPTAGTGGATIAPTSPVFVIGTVSKAASQLTINTGMEAFSFAPPQIFSGWYPLYIHSGWNRYSDTGSTYSNSDRTVYNQNYNWCSSTDFYSAGTNNLVYAEIKIEAFIDPINEWLGVYVGDPYGSVASVEVQNDGKLWGTVTGYSVPYSHLVYGVGDTVGVAYNVLTDKVWFRVNGGAWNAGGTANPVTGVGGLFIGSAASSPVVINFEADRTGDMATLNTGTMAFRNAPPAGYSAWYGTIIAPTGRAKVWSGSAWAQKPAKVWSGSAWQTKPVKVWNGSAWI